MSEIKIILILSYFFTNMVICTIGTKEFNLNHIKTNVKDKNNMITVQEKNTENLLNNIISFEDTIDKVKSLTTSNNSDDNEKIKLNSLSLLRNLLEANQISRNNQPISINSAIITTEDNEIDEDDDNFEEDIENFFNAILEIDKNNTKTWKEKAKEAKALKKKLKEEQCDSYGGFIFNNSCFSPSTSLFLNVILFLFAIALILLIFAGLAFALYLLFHFLYENVELTIKYKGNVIINFSKGNQPEPDNQIPLNDIQNTNITTTNQNTEILNNQRLGNNINNDYYTNFNQNFPNNTSINYLPKNSNTIYVPYNENLEDQSNTNITKGKELPKDEYYNINRISLTSHKSNIKK